MSTISKKEAMSALRAAGAWPGMHLDGAGPARRGWAILRGAKLCFLGTTAVVAVDALRATERAA